MEKCSNRSYSDSEVFRTSELSVSFKEIFILFLFFLLLLFSIVSFLDNWSKNYRGINHVPFYLESSADNGVSELHWEDEDSIDPTENKMVKIVRAKSVMEKKKQNLY